MIGTLTAIILGALASAQAEAAADRLRTQLVAQGYQEISVSQSGDRLQVTAKRGKLILETSLDAETGEIVAERVRQQDKPAAAGQ